MERVVLPTGASDHVTPVPVSHKHNVMRWAFARSRACARSEHRKTGGVFATIFLYRVLAKVSRHEGAESQDMVIEVSDGDESIHPDRDDGG